MDENMNRAMGNTNDKKPKILYTTVYELSGEIKWVAGTVVGQKYVEFKPGKLTLSKFVDSFFIQCLYEDGFRNTTKHKLDMNQLYKTRLVTRNGKFTLCIPDDGSTRFVVRNADEHEIETFVSYLDRIKRQVMSNAATKNKKLIGHIEPIIRVETEWENINELLKKKERRDERKRKREEEEKKCKGLNFFINLSPVKEYTPVTYSEPLFVVEPEELPEVVDDSQKWSRFGKPGTPLDKVKELMGENESFPQRWRSNDAKGFYGNSSNSLGEKRPKKTKVNARSGLDFPTSSPPTPVRKDTSATNSQTPQPKKVSQNKVECEHSRDHQTLKKTPATVPRLVPHPNNRLRQEKPVSERKTIPDASAEDDFENINFVDDLSAEKIKPTTVKFETQRQRLFPVESPKKQEILNESPKWSRFGKPATPQGNESSEISRPSNANDFYGNRRSSVLVTKRIRKPKRRCSLNFQSSSAPTPTRRDTPSTISPTAPTHSVKSSSLASYSSFATGEVTSQGFTNLGNTCYMNAMLQSILGLAPFVQELENNDILNIVGQKSLYTCMYNLFRCKNDDGSSMRKKNALRRLKTLISSSESRERFRGQLQNDAHEFMNICLDQMKEEIQKSFGENSEVTATICPVVRNFEGSLRKYIRCKGCKDLATKDEVFNNLSLNIPRDSPNRVNLTKLLECFFQEEELERNCQKCECGTAVQQLKIRTLPRVLILHILRSEYRRGTQEKNLISIRAGRYLELEKFCSKDISGPPPFIFKKTSPSKPSFTESDTPFADEDFVNFAKPRRRLDMSTAEHSSDEKPGKSASSSQNSRNYPDWVYQNTPTLSPFVLSDSSDDDDLKRAKRASLREKQQEFSEEEEIKRAKIASLRRERTHFSEEERLEQAKHVSLQLETRQREEFSGAEDVTDAEIMEAESTSGSDSLVIRITGIADNTTKCTRNPDNGYNSSKNNSNTDRKRSSSVIAEPVNNEQRGLKGGAGGSNDVETPSKRRKIENRTDKKKDTDGILDDEDSQLKRALELSKKEHDKNKELEESQMEEAIMLSLALEDGRTNERYKGMVVENPDQESEPEKTWEELALSLGNISYGLVSVVNHIGSSTDAGHYISHVYDIESERWTRYDDMITTKIKEENVKYENYNDGYIYFYMHKDCMDLLKQKPKDR